MQAVLALRKNSQWAPAFRAAVDGDWYSAVPPLPALLLRHLRCLDSNRVLPLSTFRCLQQCFTAVQVGTSGLTAIMWRSAPDQKYVEMLQTTCNFLHSAAQQSTPRSHVEPLRQQAWFDALRQATPFWSIQVYIALTRMPHLVLRDSEVLLAQSNHLFRTWSAILIGCLKPISS